MMAARKRKADDIVLDLFGSRAARDGAFDDLDAHGDDWVPTTQRKVAALPADWTGTGEDIRVHCMRQGAPMPHHPNAWGGLINACLKSGLLHKTGRHGQMRAVRSHARSTPIYSRSKPQ